MNENAVLGTTIAAQATPPGRGGLAVIRISGPDAERALRALFVPASQARAFEERVLMLGRLVHEGKTLDECMAVLMRAPRSYTREDVAEIHLHGSQQLVNDALDAVFSQGVQPAQPGEFTRRAFENGRIDLSQAEAVMQLIAASGRQAADAALRQLQGGTLRFVQEAQADLIQLMAGVTAAIDYPEEISEAEAVGETAPRLLALASRLERACDERGARILEEGLQVVICGKPNAGKSSLLNALLLEDRAIVTDIPGTTRDTLTGTLEVGGIRVHLTDTAGIRESGEVVERIGVERAVKAIRSADVCLMVLDSARLPDQEDEDILRLVQDREALYIINKSDLKEHPGFSAWLEAQAAIPGEKTLGLSTQTGAGLDALRGRILALAGLPGQTALTNRRHMALARQSAEALRRVAQAMADGLPLDLCAVDLNEALASLGEITGDNFSEALLDAVFQNFCVGK